jgi:hypothetical protein
MQIIPLQAIPSQKFNITLNNQVCQISIYQKSTGLYFDLVLNNVPIVTARLCLDRKLIIRYKYLGFIGDFAFIDQKGLTNPAYQGLNSQYLLYYFEQGDL